MLTADIGLGPIFLALYPHVAERNAAAAKAEELEEDWVALEAALFVVYRRALEGKWRSRSSGVDRRASKAKRGGRFLYFRELAPYQIAVLVWLN